MSRLLLVRHGDTELNSRERYWGLSDIELSEAGLRQAERLRDRLATEKISAVYSSQLQRALLTAEVIVSRHQLGVTVCNELQETNFGRVEGLTFAEISRLYPELTEQWVNWSLQLRFPGGDSVSEVSQRVSEFMRRLEGHAPEEMVLVVAHAGTLRMLVCQLLELELKRWRQIRIDLASLSIVETYPQGAVLTLLNDVSHLV